MAPPVETALGAILGHITGGANAETFQPMNVNFGLMPPLDGRFKRADRKRAYTDRARAAFNEWLTRSGRQNVEGHSQSPLLGAEGNGAVPHPGGEQDQPAGPRLNEILS